VHARVTGITTAFTAGGIDDNLSASLPGFRIEMYGSTLQGERAV